jgi:hypothetical protein
MILIEWRFEDATPFASRTLHAEVSIVMEPIAIILAVLWLLGMATGYTMGSFIHVLLVVAVIVVLVRFIQKQKIV